MLADLQLMAILVADRDVCRRKGQSYCAVPFGDVAAIAGEHRRCLRQAVTFDDRTAGRLHPCLGDRLLYRHAAGDRGFQHAQIELAEVGMMQQRVVERVDGGEHVHLVMAQFLDEAANVARVRNQDAHAAGAYTEQEARGEREDVIERQRGDDDQPVDRRRQRDEQGVPGLHLQNIGDQVPVQQHRALGDAGSAAGILQEGDVVRPDRNARERQLAALAKRVVEFGRGRQRVGRHHLLDVPHHGIDQRAFQRAEHVAHAGDHHVFHVGRRQRLLQHQGEILQHDDDFGAAILELEFQLARFVQRVDVYAGHAGAQDAGDRHRVLQHVRHHDGHADAARETLALQPGGEGARGLVELGIGQALTHALAGLPGGVRLEAFLEHGHQRRVARGVDLGGHARRIIRQPGPLHDVSPIAARLFSGKFPTWPAGGISISRTEKPRKAHLRHPEVAVRSAALEGRTARAVAYGCRVYPTSEFR